MTPTEAASQFPENGMSTTPRTDDNAGCLIDAEEVVLADFARTLETELAAMTARAEKAESECVEWRRLLHMSRDDREQDLVSEINEWKRQLIARAEQTKAPYTEPKAP